MISLSYAKKIGNRYILNFYADSPEDIASFDANKPFMFYGAPLAGSLITCTMADIATNYYVNKDGALVEIGGETPAEQPVAFEEGLTISGIAVDPNALTKEETDAWLANLEFTKNRDESNNMIVLVDTGHEVGSIFAFDEDVEAHIPRIVQIAGPQKEFVNGSEIVVIFYSPVSFVHPELDPNQTVPAGWSEIIIRSIETGRGAKGATRDIDDNTTETTVTISSITQTTYYDFGETLTVIDVHEDFADLNNGALSALEAAPEGLTAFEVDQIVSGFKFNATNEGERIINELFDNMLTYIGVDDNGDIDVVETSVYSLNTDAAGWNGVIIGNNTNGGGMTALQVNDDVTKLRFNISMGIEDVVSVISGFTYVSDGHRSSICPLVTSHDGDHTFIAAIKQEAQSGEYNYFIVVDTDGVEKWDRDKVIVFASSSEYFDENSEEWIDLGKSGWIDEYTVYDEVSAEPVLLNNGVYIGLGMLPVDDGTDTPVYMIYIGGSEGDQRLDIIWASKAFEMEIGTEVYISAIQGWQNLTDGVYNVGYNDIVTLLGVAADEAIWNGALVGAIVEDAEIYKIEVEHDSSKGSYGIQGETLAIPEGGQLFFRIYANSDYNVPDTVTVVNATLNNYVKLGDDEATFTITNPVGEVTITIEFEGGTPPAPTLTPFVADGSTEYDAIIIDPNGMSESDLSDWIVNIKVAEGDSLTLLKFYGQSSDEDGSMLIDTSLDINFLNIILRNDPDFGSTIWYVDSDALAILSPMFPEIDSVGFWYVIMKDDTEVDGPHGFEKITTVTTYNYSNNELGHIDVMDSAFNTINGVIVGGHVKESN